MKTVIVGRFPPPRDGQSMATERLAELLHVPNARRFNTEPPSAGYVAAETTWRWDRVWHYLTMRSRLRQFLREAAPSHIIWASISPHPLGHLRDLLTVLSVVPRESRLIAWVHRATLHELFLHRVWSWSARRLARRVDAFVFLSRSISARVAPFIAGNKRIIIPNTLGAGFTANVPDSPPLATKDSPIRLLFLSNMMPEKGYHDVLEAIRMLRDRGMPIQADFAGGWIQQADEAAFSAWIEAHDLTDRIEHHGWLQDAEAIAERLSVAHIFVLPTYHPTEAQPLSIIEALASGCATITTTQGGISDMLEGCEASWFVDSKSPEQIADAVTEIAKKDLNSVRKSAYEHYKRHFSPDAVTLGWLGLLGRIG